MRKKVRPSQQMDIYALHYGLRPIFDGKRRHDNEKHTGKAAAIVLMAALIGACSSNDAKEQAAARAEADRVVAEQAAAEAQKKAQCKLLKSALKRLVKPRDEDSVSWLPSMRREAFFTSITTVGASDDARAAMMRMLL